MERTPEEYVERMVQVFREVRRVLRDDGTVWLNLGDSYGSVGGDTYAGFNQRWNGTGGPGSKQNTTLHGVKEREPYTGLRSKNLVGIPWRVAFALQADGWYLRQDIIWHKPNPMPESVRDRCTKAHEYIFLLSKSARYYYDADGIAEQATDWGPRDRTDGKYHNQGTGLRVHTGLMESYPTRNRRSVWTIATQPFSEAHFAVFPPRLIEPCILAGAPAGGLVLDPFCGSGTTGMVALRHGRRFLGIELNGEYVEMAHRRIQGDMPLFNMQNQEVTT